MHKYRRTNNITRKIIIGNKCGRELELSSLDGCDDVAELTRVRLVAICEIFATQDGFSMEQLYLTEFSLGC